ncbi:MAG: Wzz/FepE/Etk N-terminal domain-containing protein [Thermoleophilia bacterium]
MDREITLRDYGRVLWSGRWIILTAAVVAVLVGLVLTLVTTTEYVARSQLYLGQVTTPSGSPVSTPETNPSLAPTVLRGDGLVAAVAERLGVSPSRVRSGVHVSSPRIQGGSAGNQPTLVAVTFTDRSRDIARDGANYYVDAIYRNALDRSKATIDYYTETIRTETAELTRLQKLIERLQSELDADPGADRQAALSTQLISASSLVGTFREDLTLQQQNLRAEQDYGQPRIVTSAENPRSSKDFSNRARTLLLALAIGVIVGIVCTFVWRGSPAGRAARV